MGPTWYEATAGPRPSRPPLAGIVEAEVCVIGAGFAGLATAISLIERDIRDVVVLEAQQVGDGASGRNAGFVAAGYALDCASLFAQQGPLKARTLFALTRDALETIRDRIAHYRIDCDAVDGGALWANAFDDDARLRRRRGPR